MSIVVRTEGTVEIVQPVMKKRHGGSFRKQGGGASKPSTHSSFRFQGLNLVSFNKNPLAPAAVSSSCADLNLGSSSDSLMLIIEV